MGDFRDCQRAVFLVEFSFANFRLNIGQVFFNFVFLHRDSTGAGVPFYLTQSSLLLVGSHFRFSFLGSGFGGRVEDSKMHKKDSMKINIKEIFVCLVISFVIALLSRYTGGELMTPYISGVTPPTFKHGWPVKFYYKGACGIIPLSGKCPLGWINPLGFLLNLVFWFLLVSVSWQLLKLIRVRIKNK